MRGITAFLSAIMIFEQLIVIGSANSAHAADVNNEKYSIEYRITNTWDGGCNAEIVLNNLYNEGLGAAVNEALSK